MTRVLHPRLAARRSAVRSASWWGRAWVRAVEEAADGGGDLVRGRAAARSGTVGQISVEPGRLWAAVIEGDDVWTASVSVPVLESRAVEAFVETVAAESGRAAALLAGDLPIGLVEHAEEAGVELLPYGGELEATCSCRPWADPCVHALAVLQQVAWLLDSDPLLLVHLRGLDREELLARLHERVAAADGATASDVDLDEGLDAALRARRVLELLELDPTRPVDHLF